MGDVLPFEEDNRALAADATDHVESGVGSLTLTLGTFEGPIDVLLRLAREQKVDLIHISILELAEQYLAFVAEARSRALELAADYLVMAAWLAYLKSRLLLPSEPGDEEPSGEELAAALQFQLQRLEVMQEAGAKLMQRPQLGRDVFARGMAEGISFVSKSTWEATLYDLLKAYADHKRREGATSLEIEPLNLYSVDDALHRLERFLGMTGIPDWTVLSAYLPREISEPLLRKSALCAHFIASLELVKQGRLELRQEGGHFSPIQIRACQSQNDRHGGNDEGIETG